MWPIYMPWNISHNCEEEQNHVTCHNMDGLETIKLSEVRRKKLDNE